MLSSFSSRFFRASSAACSRDSSCSTSSSCSLGHCFATEASGQGSGRQDLLSDHLEGVSARMALESRRDLGKSCSAFGTSCSHALTQSNLFGYNFSLDLKEEDNEARQVSHVTSVQERLARLASWTRTVPGSSPEGLASREAPASSPEGLARTELNPSHYTPKPVTPQEVPRLRLSAFSTPPIRTYLASGGRESGSSLS